MGKFYIDINPNEPSVAVSVRPTVAVQSLDQVPIEAVQPISTMPDIIIQEKIVEKPIEIIREILVEKIVEVPVEKVITEIQRVEIPVEVVKEVIVEKEVIKEIEVPVEIERLVFREVVRLDTTKLVLAIVSSLIVGAFLGKVL